MDAQVNDAPKHLRNKINELFTVKRFGNYSKGIFSDNSGLHTLRGINLIDRLPLSTSLKNKVKEIYWLHDIPEIIIFDYTVIQKQDKVLEQKLAEKEKSAAKSLLNDKEQILLAEFNLAEKVLKGKGKNKLPKPEAVIAALVDRIEGNVYFHKYLTKWITSQNYDRKKIPPQKALTYTFRTQELFEKNVAKCKLSKTYMKAAKYLLNYQINKVVKFWKNVSKSKMPQDIKALLKLCTIN